VGGQRGVGLAQQGHYFHALALDERQKGAELVGLAAFRDDDGRVAAAHQAQVAVEGVGGVEEEGRRPGRGQCGRDLLADEAGLADPGDDHLVPGAQQQLHRLGEIRIEPRGQLAQLPGLRPDDLLPQGHYPS